MIFGTDGLRAPMGEHPLNRSTIMRLSSVLAAWLPTPARVVLGCDTRQSCAEVAAWITAAFADVTIEDLGVVPTPVVAFETQARGADLGIMITASHNPARDNGLKFFDAKGLKIKYDQAMRWSDQVAEQALLPVGPTPARKSIKAPEYRQFLLEHFKEEQFRGLRMAFDFAHGAATHLGSDLIAALKLDARVIGNTPDGHNINQDVGALHPDKLVQLVRDQDLDVGFAMDGDGDRLIVVDREGPLHGDLVLFALKHVMEREGRKVDTVVGTIMCGMGLEQTLARLNTRLVRTPVGDQNVLAEMTDRQLLLGGEPSGHLIQGDLFPAGDGLMAALRLARALAADGDLLGMARSEVPVYPIFEKAYPVRHKPQLNSIPELQQQLDDLTAKVSGIGQVIVRYSGTESKIRVYLEAPDLGPFSTDLEQLRLTIQKVLA